MARRFNNFQPDKSTTPNRRRARLMIFLRSLPPWLPFYSYGEYRCNSVASFFIFSLRHPEPVLSFFFLASHIPANTRDLSVVTRAILFNDRIADIPLQFNARVAD